MKGLIYAFPLVFVFELIFGVSGTMIMLQGIAIRHILFILTFVSLYGYMFYYIRVNNKKIFSRKKDAFFGSFTYVDVGAVVFEISMLFSMTIIPYLKGTNLQYAKSEVLDSAAIFSLFFAISYLIKEQQLDIHKLFRYLKLLIFIFALFHLILYFGQEINPSFIENFFVGFNNMIGGNGIVQKIVLGHGGYTRVMFNTSIYLIIGLFLFFYNLNKNYWYDYVILIIDILAIISTITKSLWFGVGISFCILIVALSVYGWKNNKKVMTRAIGAIFIAIFTIIFADHILFNRMITIRLNNAFVVNVDQIDNKTDSKTDNTTENKIDNNAVADNSDIIVNVQQENLAKPVETTENLDREGAAESNSIKIEQIGKLLERWRESPIVGLGYGSYVEDYLRSEDAPFSYEMQFFSLLMKIGVLGVLIWIIFFVLQFIQLVRNKDKNWIHVFAWLFLLGALVICVQTNPLLISFSGMSVILFLSFITVSENFTNKMED